MPLSRLPKQSLAGYMSRSDQWTLRGLNMGAAATGTDLVGASAITNTPSATAHVYAEFGESSRIWTFTAARLGSLAATRSARTKSLSSPELKVTMRRVARSSTATSEPFGITSRATSAMISAAAGIDSATSPRRFGSEYDIWLVPSAKSPRNGASAVRNVFTISTITPCCCCSMSASDTSGFTAPKSNWRWRRACAATAAARCAAFAPLPFGSARKDEPLRKASSPRSVRRGNALERRISASRLTSGEMDESKSSLFARLRSKDGDMSTFAPYAASCPTAWLICSIPRLWIELSAIAANSSPFSVSATATVISPRGPTSRNTRYPSACIAFIVSRNLTGCAQRSAVSFLAGRALFGSFAACAQEYTSHTDSCFIQFPANFFTPATIGLHFGVLNGRSSASLMVRMPAEANARIASSS